MSTDTRDVLTVVPVTTDGTQTVQEATPVVDTPETREAKKARLTRVLDRGLTADRLHVPLPPHIHGEWVPNDQSAIFEKEALGFRVDTEYAPKRTLHSKGDGKSIVGDTIFMTCEKENHDLILEIRNDQYQRLNHKGAVQKEEKDFNNLTRKEGLEPTNEGSIDSARKEEITKALGITE